MASVETDGAAVDGAKAALRQRVLDSRRRLAPIEIVERAQAIAGDLLDAAPEIARAAVVAAYVSVGNEPGTGPLLAALVEREVRVLLPVLLPDGDLDWAPHADTDRLVPARFGLLEPNTALLGPAAIAAADAVIAPALAVDRAGHRLGRGLGCYERGLRRLPAGVWRCAVVYDEELLAGVPADPHDEVVDAAATPGGLHRFTTRAARRR